MPDLANLGQAFQEILKELELTDDMCRRFVTSQAEILEAMRRAYRLAEAKEELARSLSERGPGDTL